MHCTIVLNKPSIYLTLLVWDKSLLVVVNLFMVKLNFKLKISDHGQNQKSLTRITKAKFAAYNKCKG
jgi:hypothetical protein